MSVPSLWLKQQWTPEPAPVLLVGTSTSPRHQLQPPQSQAPMMGAMYPAKNSVQGHMWSHLPTRAVANCLVPARSKPIRHSEWHTFDHRSTQKLCHLDRNA